jgi:hypothetical protein
MRHGLPRLWLARHPHQVAIDKRISGVGRCAVVDGQSFATSRKAGACGQLENVQVAHVRKLVQGSLAGSGSGLDGNRDMLGGGGVFIRGRVRALTDGSEGECDADRTGQDRTGRW